jgi:GT2 family glycosyltransferase
MVSALTPGTRLLHTQVLDTDYYAAQAGKHFPSRAATAEHFVRFGMKAGLSLHPLFELSHFPTTLRDAYKRGDVESVLRYLRSDASRTHTWSPLFDPAGAELGDAAGSVLLSKYRPTTTRPLPLPAGSVGDRPTWLDVRARVLEHAGRVYDYLRARRPLRYGSWDAAAEDAWVSRLSRTPPPRPVGDRPVVSIVMPVWNRERTVHQAIESVLTQTLESWELLVVDDGSTDGTRAVVATYAETDPRIRLVAAEHRGVSATRNTGIDEARGRFVAFLDSDNTWRSDFLHRMTTAMDRGGHRAGYAAVRMLNERVEYMGQPVTKLNLLNQNYVDLNVLVLETALARDVGGFDVTLRRWVDHDLALRVADRADIEYFPFIGCDYLDDDSADRITRTESENWRHAVLGKAVLAWPAPVTAGPAGEVAAVVRVRGSAADGVRTVRSLLEQERLTGADLLVLDELDGQRESIRLFASLAGVAGLSYLKLPRPYTPAIAANLAVRHAPAQTVLLVRDGVELRPGAVERLVAACAEPGVVAAQPLLVDGAGVVLSAGGVSEGRGPEVPLFRGLAIMDCEREPRRDVDSLTPEVFLVRRDVVETMGGFRTIFGGDAAIVDFFRRTSAAGRGSFRVDAGAIAVDRAGDPARPAVDLPDHDLAWLAPARPPRRTLADHHAGIGLEVRHLTTPPRPRRQPLVPLVGRPAHSHPGEAPSLRWAVKICASFTTGGDRWGDVPYAADLADALRSRGQQVVVDREGAFARPSNHLDDVVLVLRGLHRCYPQEGRTNAIWVISRPDLVTREELAEFDLVFVASEPWCRRVREEWGIDAVFLPQATNPARFNPWRAVEARSAHDLVFVGGPRRPVGRKVVADCMAAGFGVQVVGPRWQEYVPEQAILADFIPNDHVGPLYATSRIVLNDHFDDMAAAGFVNNRLYDAVASGARVLSDDVPGIAEIFGGAVQTYRDTEDLARILGDPAAFPSDDEMRALSEHVRSEHTFDRRAGVLLEAVLEHRGGRRVPR